MNHVSCYNHIVVIIIIGKITFVVALQSKNIIAAVDH